MRVDRFAMNPKRFGDAALSLRDVRSRFVDVVREDEGRFLLLLERPADERLLVLWLRSLADAIERGETQRVVPE